MWQEFVDARRLPTIQSAPQVLYTTRDPPLELKHLPGLKQTEDVGYVTFVLFPRHFANTDIANGTISHIQNFRDYLHYHIKCSKAYMHSRMRHRVTEFQKVLNRAKTEVAVVDRKTVRCVCLLKLLTARSHDISSQRAYNAVDAQVALQTCINTTRTPTGFIS